MCKTDSALVPERPKLEDIIALAHPLANVVILNGNADDENYAAVCSKLEHHDWDFNEEHDPDHDSLDSPGPKCHLCGQEIWDISNPVTVAAFKDPHAAPPRHPGLPIHAMNGYIKIDLSKLVNLERIVIGEPKIFIYICIQSRYYNRISALAILNVQILSNLPTSSFIIFPNERNKKKRVFQIIS
ncbi:hypothetical protein Fcan01_27752 [Folsomia candida]|uniref:Uncharacterized protein n=1 Tax=Folsomia candida TaxID=158441 RepID=A0A226CWV5_FOLCA|nr:hypothetical protein Fcan01_27752 [Folsomia candida]